MTSPRPSISIEEQIQALRWSENGGYLLPQRLADSILRELAQARTALEWIANDAKYKAPEQIGDVALRWLDRVNETLAPRGEGESK